MRSGARATGQGQRGRARDGCYRERVAVEIDCLPNGDVGEVDARGPGQHGASYRPHGLRAPGSRVCGVPDHSRWSVRVGYVYVVGDGVGKRELGGAIDKGYRVVNALNIDDGTGHEVVKLHSGYPGKGARARNRTNPL